MSGGGAPALPLAPAALEELEAAVAAVFRGRRAFFVTGAGRSGTTSCIRVLGTATNAETVSEPRPRLPEVMRAYASGQLRDPRPAIWRARAERIWEVLQRGLVYGEKDLQSYCALRFYRELFDGRFVLVRRDGRDVVRSFMDMHYQVSGNMYHEVADHERLSQRARQRLAQLPDSARIRERSDPRPPPGDPFFEEWPALSRFEMLAWYWAHVTRTAQMELYRMEPDRWTEIDYSGPLGAADFEPLFEHLGLAGFDPGAVAGILEGGTRSIETLAEGAVARHPRWPQWSAAQAAAFDRIAAPAMVEMGYYAPGRLDFRCTEAAYAQSTFEPPEPDFVDRLWGALAEAVPDELPGAGGLLVGGPPAAGEGWTRWGHGALASIPEGPFERVVAIAVIDRVCEMDRLLLELARRTGDRLLIVASRGHFDTLIEHEYRGGDAGPWHNRWCTARAQSLLTRACGFVSVRVQPLHTGDPLRPVVSLLSARRRAA